MGVTTEKGPVAKSMVCKRSGNENREEACVLFHNSEEDMSGTVLARGDTARGLRTTSMTHIPRPATKTCRYIHKPNRVFLRRISEES